MLEDKAVDAIVIATPDHWHAPAAILACAAGKDVYVEKPCSHNPREGELLVAAAKKHQRIVQMGNQRRSWPAVINAIEGCGQKDRPRLLRPVVVRQQPGRDRQAAPDRRAGGGSTGICGRDPRHAVSSRRTSSTTSGTGIGTGGPASWATTRCTRSTSAAGHLASTTRLVSSRPGGRYHFDDDQETPDTQTIAWEFANGKQISFENLSCNRHGVDGTGFGASILGTEGSVTIGLREWIRRDLRGKEIERKPIAGGNRPHVMDFIQAMRSRKAPNSEILGGHQSTLLCHLGNIAQRAGESAALRLRRTAGFSTTSRP